MFFTSHRRHIFLLFPLSWHQIKWPIKLVIVKFLCHATISISLTSESVSGDDKIESTCERCGDDIKLCVEPNIESAMQLLISICVLLWWWWWWWWCKWFCIPLAWWFGWFCWFDDDNNGSQCCISIFGSFLRPQLPFKPLWPILNGVRGGGYLVAEKKGKKFSYLKSIAVMDFELTLYLNDYWG